MKCKQIFGEENSQWGNCWTLESSLSSLAGMAPSAIQKKKPSLRKLGGYMGLIRVYWDTVFSFT